MKVLGHIADSDGLLDCIKEDCEELTMQVIIRGLNDPSTAVREAASQVVGVFAENVIPDFLELHETVMPVLLQWITS